MKRKDLILLLPVLVIVPLLSIIRYVWCIIAAPDKAKKIALGYDHLGNVAFNGNPGESISSRAGRHIKDEKWACWLCKFLDKFEEDHCKKSIGS